MNYFNANKKSLHIFKPKIKRLLGVDIRTFSIHLVELSCFESNYQVEASESLMLDTAVSDDVVIDELKKKLRQRQGAPPNVVSALPHSAIIFKEVKIDRGLTDKEIENFLQFNMEKHTGKAANNISFDYQIIETPSAIKKRVMLRLIVAQREQIEKRTKLLRAANLCPKIIDIDSYALERAVRRQFKEFPGLIAIVNINREAVLIVVIDRKKIVYVHEDFVNAEEKRGVAQIIVQFKIKMQLVFDSLPQPLEKIILAGESAMLSGLRGAINVQLNVPTIIIDPFLGMKLSPSVSHKIRPEMLISCGLALRAVDGCWS
jgi:type IV pilus assembly protein PilM